MAHRIEGPFRTFGSAERPAAEPRLPVLRRTATRADLLDALCGKNPELPRAEARMVFEAALEEMTQVLARGEPVRLRAFGLFSVRAKRERMGRNPRTGAEVPITPRRVLTFKPSPVLVDAVNDGARPGLAPVRDGAPTRRAAGDHVEST